MVEIYLLSAGVGSIYLIISFLMGQMDGHGDASGGDGGGHGGADAAGADSSGADFSASDAAGADSGGADFSGHDAAGADSSGADAGDLHPTASSSGAGQHLPVPATRRGRLLFTILSPMTISMFLSFFGISGMILSSVAAFLGPLTVIPALIIGFLITRILLGTMKTLTAKLHVTSVVRTKDLVGQVGKITVPIKGSGNGQVTYTVGGMRCQSIAKPAKEGTEFHTGSKVIIADYKDRIAYVENFSDDDL